MKKNIKIIIDNKIVDASTDSLSYAVTKQIADFSDITKRTGAFSYTIKLPRTKRNKEIFGSIDETDTINRFKRFRNYEAKLEVNGSTIIDGFFILRSITPTDFEGNITNRFGDIFTQLGDKTLQDLKLPEIDFEGTMIPYEWKLLPNTTIAQGTNLERFERATNDCLNKDLCFDFRSLTEAYKSPAWGLINSEIDYRDYYRTSFVQYSNFYVSPSKTVNQLNTFINNFSLSNFMPQIKMVAVIKQLFSDIGYNVVIKNNLFGDDNLLMPYFGPDEPKWNWLQLSRTSIFTDKSKIQNNSKVTTPGNSFGRWVSSPVVNSRESRSLVGRKSIFTNPFVNNNFSSFNRDIPNQFTDEQNAGLPTSNSSPSDCIFQTNLSDDAVFKAHYLPTNGIKYDFNNNFSVLSPPYVTDGDTRDSGHIYTTPADGEYEFDLDINHDIQKTYYKLFTDSDGYFAYIEGKDFPFIEPPFEDDESAPIPFYELYNYDHVRKLQQDKNKLISGYQGNNITNRAGWNYNSKEEFDLGHMVIFVKGDNDLTSEQGSLFSNYRRSTFDSDLLNTRQPVVGRTSNLLTAKQLSNIDDENVIAFYHPMLRDLYHGGKPNLSWKDWVFDQGSLYKNSQAYPISEEDRFNYFGFGNETDILNFENNITSPYYDLSPDPDLSSWNLYNSPNTPAQQLQYKMVKLNTTPDKLVEQAGTGDIGYRRYNTALFPAKAAGNIKFKFKTKLKKGEQVRMYYITVSQWKQIHTVNNFGGSVFTVGRNWNEPVLPGYTPTTYADYWTDNVNINKLDIKCVSDDLYTSKLPLANFLPQGVKQKDFIVDFIKTNNIFYRVDNNQITLQTRGDFYSREVQEDLTSRVSSSISEITPIELNSIYKFGSSTNDNYDFRDFLTEVNPIVEVGLGSNIYLKQNIFDATSTIFFNTYDRPSFYRRYSINFNNGLKISNNNYTLAKNILVPSFQENNDFKTLLSESETNYDRQKRLIYFNGPGNYQSINDSSRDMLVSSLYFKNINLYESVSNKGLLLNTNRNSLFRDIFLDLQDSSYFEWYIYIDDILFSRLDLSKPVVIRNTVYYIQKVEAYNTLSNGMTKVILLKI